MSGILRTLAIAAVGAVLSACAQGNSQLALHQTAKPVQVADNAKFEADRQAILAMAGDYKVKFDFIETVSFVDGYEPKDRYISGAHEVVRVIEDTGTFISLQHILVVGGDQKFPVKHWRQDWTYEPAQVLTFVGGNAWKMRPIPEEERAGKWSQTVYQVDDSPRYGAVAAWSHENGLSDWTPKAEWRPLPRRDMTKRDDYHAVLAVNRHAITPDGWVHEQDNSKLILAGEPQVLVREIGVNSYQKDSSFAVNVAEDYWAATADYWQGVREAWSALEQETPIFALTLKGEPEELYSELLNLAGDVKDNQLPLDEAIKKAEGVIATYTTRQPAPLTARLRPTKPAVAPYLSAAR